MCSDCVHHSEIQWRLGPQQAEPASEITPSTADERGLLYADILALETHLASVQADCAAYRELVQTALDTIADLTRQLRQIQRRRGEGAVDVAYRERGDPAP